MGLFSKLNSSDDIALSPQAGLLLSAMTMSAIDGDIDEDEIAIIRRLDSHNSETNAWDIAFKTLKTKSFDECIALSKEAMNSEQKLIAMANLIDIAMADGVLGNSEQELLEAYVGVFEIDEVEITKIVDVISIKNNKSSFQ